MSTSFKLSEIMNLMLLNADLHGIPMDNNTRMLLILQRNIASILQAAMLVSEDLAHPEMINTIGLIHGLTETLEWMMDNMEVNGA